MPHEPTTTMGENLIRSHHGSRARDTTPVRKDVKPLLQIHLLKEVNMIKIKYEKTQQY
jgi:hypothetical protein